MTIVTSRQLSGDDERSCLGIGHALFVLIHYEKNFRNMIKSIFFVGIGGAIGSVMRYILGSIGAHYFKGTFPFATFITNFLGCLIIGLLIGYFGKAMK